MPATSKPPTDPIVGIDLGTTNSLVAFVSNTGPHILTDADGSWNLPSVVRYSPSGEVEAIGEPARLEAVEHPDRTISSIKRLMGRSKQDAAADLAFLSYPVVDADREAARIALPSGQLKSPEEVSAEILRALKLRAEQALGADVRRAVITVPAYFDDAQRQATRHAARLAGLDALRIVNEPTAAALAYGIGTASSKTEPETIAVFDLGGGTLDVSILRVIPGEGAGTDMFRVLSTAGDTRLGGDDVDRMLVELFTQEATAQFKTSLNFTPHTRQSMRLLAEQTKIKLSTEHAANVRIEFEGVPTAYEKSLTRTDFDSMIDPLVSRALACCERALQDAKLPVDKIDRVVMVGGSTRIPSSASASENSSKASPTPRSTRTASSRSAQRCRHRSSTGAKPARSCSTSSRSPSASKPSAARSRRWSCATPPSPPAQPKCFRQAWTGRHP